MSLLRRLFFTVRYFFRPPWDTGQSPPELIEFLEAHNPGRAIDLGCGTGTNAITLARRGWEVVAVDFAPNAILAARRKSSRLGLVIDYRVGDVVHLPVSGPFDLVLDIGCVHSLGSEDRATYFQNLTDLVREGGTYLLYTNIKTSVPTSKVGLGERDLELLSRNLKLIRREDGTNRGVEPSAWLQYRREGKISNRPRPAFVGEDLPEESVESGHGRETSAR